jgi:hypothetical protein
VREAAACAYYTSHSLFFGIMSENVYCWQSGNVRYFRMWKLYGSVTLDRQRRRVDVTFMWGYIQ